MKQQALKDMKAEIEEKRQEKEVSQQEAETARNAGAVANKAAEADMIEESLEGLGQETVSTVQGGYRQADSEFMNGTMSGSKEDNNISGAENTSTQKKILRYDEKNKGNIKEFDDQRLDEFEREKEYSHMLDDSYKMTMQVFENDNFSIKDRVDAYQRFMKDSTELVENREIERCLKIYDYRSVTDLRIKALLNQRVKTVAKTDENGQKQYVPVHNIMRSVGQAIVEEAAKEKEKTKTVVDDLAKKKKEYIEAQQVEEL